MIYCKAEFWEVTKIFVGLLNNTNISHFSTPTLDKFLNSSQSFHTFPFLHMKPRVG